MVRITQKKLKFSKALRKAGYEITMKREYGTKYYEVFSPPQEEGQPRKKVWEIINNPTEGVIILLGEDEEKCSYCEKLAIIMEEGKTVAVCQYQVNFDVQVTEKIRE